MTNQTYDLTSGGLARESGVDQTVIRLYADSGWVDCLRLANGVRLFPRGAIERVRQIRAERLTNRGRVRKESIQADDRKAA